MSLYKAYMDEIKEREKIGLSAKPIDDGELTKEIVLRIKDKNRIKVAINRVIISTAHC